MVFINRSWYWTKQRGECGQVSYSESKSIWAHQRKTPNKCFYFLTENCYFHYEDKKIHVFADVPRIMKLARNHLIDDFFYFNNSLIDKRLIQKLISSTINKDIKLAHKLTQYHLDITYRKCKAKSKTSCPNFFEYSCESDWILWATKFFSKRKLAGSEWSF